MKNKQNLPPRSKKLKKLPVFKSEKDEVRFWEDHAITDYYDVSKALVNPVFPNLKMSTRTITLRVTESLLDSLKMLANKKDVPYQSLMKVYLDEKVREEFANT